VTKVSESDLARIARQPGYAVVSDTGTDMQKSPEHRAMDAKRKNKFNAHPVEVQGLKYASKAEEKRYRELVILYRVGAISELETQPKFVLQESFADNFGRHYRAITYTADFAYIQDGRQVVEDVKGGKATQTQQFSIRWKWAIRQNPDIRFEIIGETE